MEVFGDIEKECDGFQKFSRIDTAQILDASQKARGMLYVEDFFPELLPAYEAKKANRSDSTIGGRIGIFYRRS